MRMRKKKNLGPRMERVAALLEEDPCARRGRWRDALPGAEALRLEIGCGKGTFTVETAKRHPQTLFVAVERVADALVMGMEKALAEGVSNVRFVCDDAARLEEMFAPEEVDLLYINFPDPWPSRKHAKRRLTYADFLKSYRAFLKPGGEIHFKTDNRPLFDFSLTQFPLAGYTLSQVTNDLHRDDPDVIMTDFEARFAAEGVKINRCVATVAALPEQTEQVEALSLLQYWQEGDRVPHGMERVVEQERLRQQAEERQRQRGR
ncbi:MAG: tRNA (guanosine(46)-N7)-methyltransferase TrmB [Clostridiales bacterium]|nr:tRNA (guanosine(46)-N7)-methyltransferase TrmB [Clostridiales bacterium]